MITCTPRTGPRRCALCHDGLDARTTACRACGAAHHLVCVRVPARCASCSARLVVRWRPARARRWPRAALTLAASALSIAALIGASSLVEPVRPAGALTIPVVLACADPERAEEVEVCAHGREVEWVGPHASLPGARCDECHIERLVLATHALREALGPPCRCGWGGWPRHDDDVTLSALVLRLAERGGGCPCFVLGDSVERALVWLPAQQRYGGSFPGDDLAQAQAARALGERGALPGWAQPWLYGESAPARALARALQRTPAERWSAPRTWRDVALDPRPGTLPLRLDPRRDDVRALVRTLVATQHGDGTWTRVAGELRDERPELATAVNALLLACVLFEPDGTLARGRE